MSLASITIDQESLKSSLNGLTTVREIQRGGYKIVYEAHFSGHREALKLIYLPKVADPEFQEAVYSESLGRVTREINTLKNCKRPEIVKLGQLDPIRIRISNEEFIAYSEEYVDGLNLDQVIKNKNYQTPDLSSLKCLMLSLLQAINELWKMKIIHRDIKPLNVMKTDSAKRPFILLDLGIAFAVSEIHLTACPEQRDPPGTWKYMAPEMLKPNFREGINFRSDLYTIGQTVFEYATGLHPLARSADDKIQTVSRILHQECKKLESERNDLPVKYCSIVNQMMKKNPALRPGNLERLINQVEVI